MKQRSIIRIITMVAGIAVALNVMTASAFAARPTDRDPAPAETSDAGAPPSSTHAKYECSSEANLNNVTGHGANNNDGYQSTCDEADFGGNGQEFGPGLQTGKPCAGCVGAADDKNPPGQYPDGSDSNSGFECDGVDRISLGQQGHGPDNLGNHGIGDENPAHTGCNSTTETETCPDGSPMPPTGGNCGQQDDDDDTPPFTCPANTTVKDNGDGVMDDEDCITEVQPLTIIGPTTPSSVDELETAQVQGVLLERLPEVLGVQVEQGAVAPAAVAPAAPLARTGANSNTGILVLLAAFLLALGTALVRVGGRRPAGI